MPVREEALACPVCFSEFDSSAHSPSTLPCSHTFCGSCLRHPSLVAGGRLRCPICRCLSWGRDTIYRNTDTAQAERRTQVESTVGVSIMDEAWFIQRCVLCCRTHSASPYRLECSHTLCPGCLRLLMALASPGWVTFLYCPRCQGQTAVFQATSTTPLLAAPERRPSATSVAQSLEQRQGRCCGVWVPCVLL
ncbi:hypothetical protein AAFF_G00133090 [Aldrovandia affinis]|uniref:RING-type domain-containing protein n=1 Tax=Aldrovandia affinis TaxID=143900 RepID=A0AAD7RQ99_9TELE|nr:hypothetical protein AAFF_G00133090 [Aldrovandia affinis]